MCCFHVRSLSICCSFNLLFVCDQLCAVNCNVQNLCVCSLFHGMKFPLRTSHSILLPRAGLQVVDALTSMAFLVLGGNGSCLPASLQCPWALCSLLGPGGFCTGRGREVSDDVRPSPGSWPKALGAVGQPAKPLNNLGAVTLSRNLSVWVQGRQEWPQAAEIVVVCSECVLYGKDSLASCPQCAPTPGLRGTWENPGHTSWQTASQKETTGFCFRSASSCSGGEIFNLF